MNYQVDLKVLKKVLKDILKLRRKRKNGLEFSN